VSPRSPEQNAQRRATTRERIVHHALALFSQHGYDGTSIRMIAKAAGVAQGLLYSHFEGKDALLRAIVETSMADVRESFRLAEANAPRGRRVESLIRASAALLRRNIDFWRLSYAVRMQPAVLTSLGPAVGESTQAIRATLEGYLKEAEVPAPEVEAAVLFALIDGISQHFVLDPDHYPLEAVIDRIIARYAVHTES
jgi:AcrR family transcriptional regulator